MYPNVSIISPVLCKFDEDSHWLYLVYCILYMLVCLTSILLLLVYIVPRARLLFNGNNSEYKRLSPKTTSTDTPLLRRIIPLRSNTRTKDLPIISDREL